MQVSPEEVGNVEMKWFWVTICCSTSRHQSEEDVGDKNKVNIIQKKEKGHTKRSPGAAILPGRPQKRLWLMICCSMSEHQSEEDAGDDTIDRRQKQGEYYPWIEKGPHENFAGRCHSPWAATEMYVMRIYKSPHSAPLPSSIPYSGALIV